MRRVLVPLAAVLLIAAVVIGLTQAGTDTEEPAAPRFDLQAALQDLEGSPAPLAGLHRQANELLGGGRDAFDERLAELRGHPVVVNKWASWCGPCKAEFPAFQRLSSQRGQEIAFVGVNAGDKRPAAERFLDRYPVPFPSYEDPDEDISRALDAPSNYPITIFLDERGRMAYIHQGGYARAADLAADIDRYLGA
jgi:thiol-disulfide isomerase/thioredoxin